MWKGYYGMVENSNKMNKKMDSNRLRFFKINQDKKSFEIDQNLNYKLSNKNIFNFY